MAASDETATRVAAFGARPAPAQKVSRRAPKPVPVPSADPLDEFFDIWLRTPSKPTSW